MQGGKATQNGTGVVSAYSGGFLSSAERVPGDGSSISITNATIQFQWKDLYCIAVFIIFDVIIYIR
jgi:hypothetical protein